MFPHLPVRRDAFILRVIDRYIAANISGVELQETEPVSRHKFRSRHGVPILNTWMDRNQVAMNKSKAAGDSLLDAGWIQNGRVWGYPRLSLERLPHLGPG